MSSSAFQAPTLATLPVDIIGALAKWLLAEQIYKLWRSGDKGLNLRLAQPGAVDRWIHEDTRFQGHIWPNLVSSFQHLAIFELHTSTVTCRIRMLNKFALGTLPSTLQVLKLTHPSAEDCWLQAGLAPHMPGFKTWRSQFRSLKELYLDGMSAWGDVAIETFLPESLESLSLPNNTHIHNLKRLPPNLTRLYIPKMKPKQPFNAEQAALLPRTLKIFSTPIVFQTDSIGMLPPSLSSMALSIHYTSITCHQTFSHLPRSITKLEVRPPPTPILPEVFSLLPSDLQSLTMVITNGTIISSLSELPRGLTSLLLSSPKSVQGTVWSQLPPNLTELTFNGLEHIPQNAIAILPRFLIALRLPSIYELRVANLADLPRGLQELKIGRLHYDDSMQGHSLQSLPDTLTSLSIGNCESLPSHMLHMFPQGIQHLDLEAARFNSYEDRPCFASLPHSLKTLSLSSCQGVEDNGMQYLPRSIRDLTILPTSNLSALGLNSLPSLTFLCIALPPQLTPEICRALPRSISLLSSSQLTNITRECFAQLPPDLVSFNGFSDHKILQEYWEWRGYQHLLSRYATSK